MHIKKMYYVSSYCCSTNRIADPFSSLDSFSSSSIGGPVIHPIANCEHPLLFARHWHSLTRDSYIWVLSAKPCWWMQWCQRLEVDYGMDPHPRVWQSLDGPSGFSQSAIGWITGPPMEELEKVPKELKGSATL